MGKATTEETLGLLDDMRQRLNSERIGAMELRLQQLERDARLRP